MVQLMDMQHCSQLNLANNIVNHNNDELDQRYIVGGYHARVVMQLMNNHYEIIAKGLTRFFFLKGKVQTLT